MDNKQVKQDESEINFFDIIIVLLKRKRLIVGITLSTAVMTAIISFLLPSIYRAEVKILPPQSSSSPTQIMSQMGPGGAAVAAMMIGGGVGAKTPSELYFSILKSRAVLDRIIDRCKLMDVHKGKSREKVRNSLIATLQTSEDKKSGMLIVAVEDNDPKWAADIVNISVEEFKEYQKGIAITEASKKRLFFEEQLKDAQKSLVSAEEDMRNFMSKPGGMEAGGAGEKGASADDGVGSMRAHITAKEVQLRVMKTYSTEQNPEYLMVENEIKGLKEQLKKLEGEGTANYEPMLNSRGRASLGTEAMRKKRNLKYSETLYELMFKQYEAAKIDESREPALIQVLEKAIPPEERIKPKRRQMVMFGATAGFVFSLIAVFFMEYFEKSSNSPESRERFESIKRYASFKKFS
ncbi:MAG: hypothetical protein HQL10_03315 [Nitrospirae bacterium]|nr:hypothetical protein [Nitrospirota bacterium]